MELKEFIAETLKQINDGLKEGSNFIIKSGGEGVKDNYFNVSFDVALTTNNEETKGGKIEVASIIKFGREKEKISSTNNFSRIQFHVPVCIKTQ